jgi:Fe-S-cluster containining protein
LHLRLDPEQRFTCQQCGRCCRRWDVLITAAERDGYAKRGVARWFRESDSPAEGTDHDPFEPVSGWRGYYRIRSRSNGECGFLSSDNRCRIHEELGSAAKPLTCRMFPFKFHPVAGGAVVTASFGCPTIVANRGEPVSSDSLEDTYREVAAAMRPPTTQRQFVAGRTIDNASIHIIRESLLRMLSRTDAGGFDLRANVQRMAHALDDLTRSRVLRLPDEDFAEYIKLTLPYAAASTAQIQPSKPGRIGRLMQFGFLYVVAATRYGIEHRADSVWSKRIAGVRMLAHFHRLAPAIDRVDVRALGRGRVDINAPGIEPPAYHYLRGTIEALGARERPLLDDFAIGVSCLNAACALAIMNAHASGRPIDRQSFSEALMESVDVLQADDRGVLGWALPRLAAGVEALKLLSAPTQSD